MTLPSVALIVEVPPHPGRQPVRLMVATEVVAEAQVTWSRLRRVVGVGAGGGELLGQPLGDHGMAGVTAIDWRGRR